MKIWSSICGVVVLVNAFSWANSLPTGNHFSADYANLPISFEANIGQAESAIEFLAHGHNGDLLLTSQEAWLTLQNNGKENEPGILRLKLSGANPHPKLEGLDPLPGKANYFSGNDPGRWRTDVPTFAKVKYGDVYPGVDLVYYGNQQRLEYDFIIQPGANPNVIALEFAGADKITLDANGDLLFGLPGDSVRQHKPIVYQEIDGQRKILSGEYVLRSGMQVGFQVGDYDKTKPLIIDPVLSYSAIFGGNGLNQALGIAVDAQANVYVTGVTTASDFPTTNAFQNVKRGSRAAFVVKFNTNGVVVYSTYLGGGATNDVMTTTTSGQGIAVDFNGDAFVTGFTTTTNFPTQNAFQSAKATAGFNSRNAFVTKLNPAGNALVYSTYLGGTTSDTATGIALDTNNDAIITGFATSTNFPIANAVQATNRGSGDAFVTKLSADGRALVYSTYLGGSKAENQDLSATGQPPLGAVAVDFDGNAYVTGATYSTNFPVLNAFQRTNQTIAVGVNSAAFVTKLDPAGNIVYSTYFAGMFGDYGRAIGVDFFANVYFAGNSKFGDLPTTNAFQPAYAGRGTAQLGDGFVAALDSTGTNLIYCTYLGGSGDEQINGIAVRPDDGAVAVTGFTDSPNFPLANPVQSKGFQGLFKSSNGAATWNLSNNGITSGIIYSIQIDPSNPAKVYALTPTGCFRSTDGGANWTSASSGLGFISPSFSGGTASLLAIDPLHPATLYAASFLGVYKTTNGAANWTPVTNGLPNFPGIQTVAVDPTVPTTLYAGTASLGVYKSTDGGSNWSAMNTGLSILNIYALLVDPQNSSNVYAGTENFTTNPQLFKSTNGGGNWTLLGGGIKGGSVDMLAAGLDNPATIYVVIGNDTGFPVSPVLDASTNGGATWSPLLQASGFTFTALAIGPPKLPALSIAVSGSNDLVSWPASFAGFALQSTPLLIPANWQNVPQTPVTTNGKSVVTVPRSGSQGFFRLLLTNSGALLSAFGLSAPLAGNPVSLTRTDHLGAPQTGDQGGVRALNSGDTLPPTIYLGTDATGGYGVLECTDGGHAWISVGLDGDTCNAVSPDPVNPETAFCGVNGGHDGFVCMFTPDGQLNSSTYVGGSGADQCNVVALNGLTTVCVAGSTVSKDFPTTVAPVVAPSPPAATGSFIPRFNGNFTITSESVFGPCPMDNTVTEPIILTSGNYDVETIGKLGPLVSIVAVRGTPPGLDISSESDLSLDEEIFLKGTPTTPGAYFVDIKLSGTSNLGDPCTWIKTYRIIVN